MSLKEGQTNEISLTVTDNLTAEAATTLIRPGSDDKYPPVFSTANMVAAMEFAAGDMMKSLLKDTQLSVGVDVQIKHTSATPVGDTVKAIATFKGIDKGLYQFDVEAFDSGGSIGKGKHSRAIIELDRLMAGANKKLQ